MILFLLLLLTPASVGPGTEFAWDTGYYTRPEGQPGRRWVSIPKTIVVLGHEEEGEARITRRNAKDWFVCVRKGDSFPYDRFFIVHRNQLLAVFVTKQAKGELVPIEADVMIQKP